MNNNKNSGLPVVPLYYSVSLLAICVVTLLILVFVFNIKVPEILFAPPPTNAVNVSACGILTQNDTYYVLNMSLIRSMAGPCIVLQAHNSTFDGLGKYNISASASQGFGGYTAIEIRGNVNVVQEMNIQSFTYGILNFGNDSLIQYNRFFNITGSAIMVLTAKNVSVMNNILTQTSQGIYYLGSTCLGRDSVKGIYNNSIIGRRFSPYDIGIQFTQSTNCNVNSNIVINFTQGIALLLDISSNNDFRDNLVENQVNGVYSSGGASNNFMNNLIRNSSGNAITLYNSVEFNLSNTQVEGTNLLYSDLKTMGYTDVNLIDMVLAKYNLTNTSIRFISLGKGKIAFEYPRITAFGNNLSSDVKIGTNFAEVDSVNAPGFNKSATIKFEGISTNVINPAILRNGVLCSPSICSSLTTLTPGNVYFSVNSWTNYTLSVGTSPIPSTMITLPLTNSIYYLEDFPILFEVNLTHSGKVSFSLNNGSTNFTMNDSLGNHTYFTYNQNALPVGTYTFIAYTNFTNSTQIETVSVNFSVNGNPPITPFISIGAPDSNDVYHVNDFPRMFIVELSQAGKVWFSLNNGSTNFTMNNLSNANTYFTYNQTTLSVGTYNFIAYANFTNSAQKATASVNFNVTENVTSLSSPFITIEEPDVNDSYLVNNFPVLFIVELSQAGKVWFSLNNGSTNFTMINYSNSNRYFTYSKNNLSIGDYTFIAYANFTNSTQNATKSVNFRVTNGIQTPISSGGPTVVIDEPSTNEDYYLNNFPVSFAVTLSQSGKVWFSLNNGSTNFTMVNSLNSNTHFTYNQNTLPVGTYNFIAYANFTNSTQKRSATQSFRVLSNLSSSPSINLTTNYLNDTPPLNRRSARGNVEFKNVIYWLVVAVLTIAIVILILLILKYFKSREVSNNGIHGNIVNRLR